MARKVRDVVLKHFTVGMARTMSAPLQQREVKGLFSGRRGLLHKMKGHMDSSDLGS